MPRAYKMIYVPVDNSGYSFAAIDLSVDLATKFDACIVGSHVFAAGVTDSYLDLMEECCRTATVKFERKTFDGRHHRMILEDIRQNQHDLVIIRKDHVRRSAVRRRANRDLELDVPLRICRLADQVRRAELAGITQSDTIRRKEADR